MPDPTVFDHADRFRAALLAQERAAAVRLVNAYGDVYRRLLPQIQHLNDAIAALPEPTPKQAMRLSQLKGLKNSIEREVGRYAIIVENEVNQGAREAIVAASKDAQVLTRAALPGVGPLDVRIMATWNRLSPDAVETLLGFLSDNSPLRQALRDQLGPAVADAVEKDLLEGIALGYNPRKVAMKIRQALGEGLTWSLRTARTAQLYAYREATRANYIANDHIVKGWIWRATLSDRTCMSCIAMDGTEHTNEERLNDHHNGRCVMIPKTITYRELGLDVEEPERTAISAREWFEEQPMGTQQEMMGKGKWSAWKSGQFEFEGLTSISQDKVYGEIRVETPLKELVGA